MLNKKIIFSKCALLITTSLMCETNCLAEKDPKAKEVVAAPVGESDPLKKTLKPGEIFNCEADIFYEWEQVTKDAAEQKKTKVFVETLVERGMDGEISKTRLENRLGAAKTKALTQCNHSHNVTECTTEKLAASSAKLRELDFQTKRTMTANLIQTCENKAGKCLESSNSEIRCQVYRSPDSATALPVTTPPPAAAPGKK